MGTSRRTTRARLRVRAGVCRAPGVRRRAAWEMRLPAVLETLGLVRTGLRRRLAQLEWPENAALDILLAVNEAVSGTVVTLLSPRFPAP